MIGVGLCVDILEVNLKLDNAKEIFGITSCFLLYFFGVGAELRFLFKSLKVSEENECFDKFITFPDIQIYIDI